MFRRGVIVPGRHWRKIALVVGLIIVTIPFFWSCEDEATEIGLEFKSVLNQVKPVYVDTLSLFTSVETMDSVVTSKSSVGILGDFVDPVFGRTRASFLSQFRLSSVWDPGYNAQVDSMKAYFEVGGYYGNELVKETINVYELLMHIDPDSTYYNTFDVGDSISEWPIGSATFVPTDSIIEVTISKTFARRIIQDTAVLDTQDEFLEAFKGIYVNVDPVNGEGAFVNLNLISSATYLAIYYHTDINNGLEYDFYINAYSARANIFQHQYDQAPPETAIQYLNQGKEDTVFYLQGIGGVLTRIDIPGLKALRDSGNIIVNSAQLIFPISPDDPIGNSSIYPDQIDVNVMDEEGQFYTIADLSFSSDYYDGTLDTDNNEYVINITKHIQGYLRGDHDYTTLYAMLRNPENSPGRVVINSRLHSNPFVLKLVYTKD